MAIGYMENSRTPATWNLENPKNLKWKTSIPGLGHSSPIVWDNYLFVTTATNNMNDESLKLGLYGDIDEADDRKIHEFKVYCLDKNSGKVLWEMVAHKGVPRSKRHTKSTQANCTPATDGKYLVVHFGSEGLYCYDLKGNLVWKKDMGIVNPGPYTDPGVEWGYASSPIIHRNKIIIQCDIPERPHILALDVNTGKELWRTSREDEVSTWCTPAIYTKGGRTQVIANGYRQICGYDFETGKKIWRLSNGGDALTGEEKYRENLKEAFSASGIAADGKIYFTSEAGVVYVIKAGAVYSLLAKNNLKDNCMATPAISGNTLYFRTQHSVIAIE
jgi:outer membrane protein assembly factor BamB